MDYFIVVYNMCQGLEECGGNVGTVPVVLSHIFLTEGGLSESMMFTIKTEVLFILGSVILSEAKNLSSE